MFCTYILHFHSKILVSIQVYDIDLYHTISPSRIQEAEIHLTHTTQHFHTLPTKVNKGTHIHNTTVCHYLHTSVSLKRQICHKSLSRLTKKFFSLQSSKIQDSHFSPSFQSGHRNQMAHQASEILINIPRRFTTYLYVSIVYQHKYDGI